MCIRDRFFADDSPGRQSNLQKLSDEELRFLTQIPVSYTHLDVYKRQQRNRPVFFSMSPWESPFCSRKVRMVVPIFIMENALFDGCRSLLSR